MQDFGQDRTGLAGKNILSALALFSLGPAFSNLTRLKEQVYRRLKTASAVAGISIPSVQKFSRNVDSFGWVTHEHHPEVEDALGYALRLDKHHRINRIVHTSDLITTDELRRSIIFNRSLYTFGIKC